MTSLFGGSLLVIVAALAVLSFRAPYSLAGQWQSRFGKATLRVVMGESEAGRIHGAGVVVSPAGVTGSAVNVTGEHASDDVVLELAGLGQQPAVVLLRFESRNRLAGDLFLSGQTPERVIFERR